MYTRKKPVTVEREYYYADDGKEFTSEDACRDYELRKAGLRKECPECHGRKGWQGKYIEPYDHWDGPMGGYYEWHECPRCKGKGYLEQKWE
jgi:hypothetical protein